MKVGQKSNDPKPGRLRIVVSVIPVSAPKIDRLFRIPLQGLGKMLRFEIGPVVIDNKNIGINGLDRQETT